IAPCARTVTVAFDGGNQANVRKAELGLVVLPGDLKDNVSAFPLSLVFDKVNVALQDMPYDFLTRYEFSDFVGAAVQVFVVELKLGAEFIGNTVNFLRPPPTNVVDRVKDFFGRLVYRKRTGVILIFHESLPFCPYVRQVTRDSTRSPG